MDTQPTVAEDRAFLEAVEKADDATLKYFQLLEHPFRGGPNYRFLYTTEQVNEAISRCIQMTVKRTNPVYMYGPYGTGKSTIIRRLYSLLSLDPRFEVKFVILHNRVTANSLVRSILEEFGIKTARSFDQSLRNLQNYLHEVNEAQKIPTLLLDEGQYMDKTALQTLHSICNYEDEYVKKLQLVITGQEELATKIHLMGEIKSRMKPVQIDPMDTEELRKMLQYRWQVAGGKEEDFPFRPDDTDVYTVLFTYTKGLPRDTIKVADDVLKYLVANEKKKITAAEIEQIAKENDL
jgi:general secretion pathway protein A